jgi:hypothetical protein
MPATKENHFSFFIISSLVKKTKGEASNQANNVRLVGMDNPVS